MNLLLPEIITLGLYRRRHGNKLNNLRATEADPPPDIYKKKTAKKLTTKHVTFVTTMYMYIKLSNNSNPVLC